MLRRYSKPLRISFTLVGGKAILYAGNLEMNINMATCNIYHVF